LIQKRVSLNVGALLVLGGAAVADVTIYDCAPNNIEKHLGWMSEQIVIFVDEENKTASVLDVYVNHVHQEAIPAKYSELSNGKFRVQWDVSGIPVRGSASGSASWSATVNPSKKNMQVRASVAGFDNRPSGRGDCKTYQQ
jgi:hypothetical protein